MLCHAVTIKNYEDCFGWCGSVDWALACKLKSHWYDSPSGYMPALWARSPVGGVWEATTQWCFPSPLSPSLPLPKNKYIKSFKKELLRLILIEVTQSQEVRENNSAQISVIIDLKKSCELEISYIPCCIWHHGAPAFQPSPYGPGRK